MDRYKDESHASRMDKNQDLYQNINSNTIYTNITDVVNANAFEINSTKNTSANSPHTTREDYQRMQKYQNVDNISHSKKELDDFNYLYQKKENKIYDINSVLEEARKNRAEVDEKDEKRKLKNNAYNILEGINREELEKYREEKKKRLLTPEEEELRDIIDTIASKTLAGEIDKATTVDLLSDLMATNMLDKVDRIDNIDSQAEKEENKENKEETPTEETMEQPKEESSATQEIKSETQEVTKPQETIENTEEEKEKTPDLKEKDPDFYTRSMDLSDKDFELSEEFKDKPLPIGIKILIFLLVLIVVAAAVFFVYQRIN